MRISHFVILVEDIDEALKFYTEKLGFVKQRDDTLWIDLRWGYNLTQKPARRSTNTRSCRR